MGSPVKNYSTFYSRNLRSGCPIQLIPASVKLLEISKKLLKKRTKYLNYFMASYTRSFYALTDFYRFAGYVDFIYFFLVFQMKDQ